MDRCRRDRCADGNTYVYKYTRTSLCDANAYPNGNAELDADPYIDTNEYTDGNGYCRQQHLPGQLVVDEWVF